MLESAIASSYLDTVSSTVGTLGITMVLRGCCLLLAWVSWCWVPLGAGILALGTTSSWHPGTRCHQTLASLFQAILAQQLAASWRDGPDVAT